ncbi:HEAT repeat domain-containing protein [Nitrolancea hollandica]|uniref:HEAT repeat domain-containing protein n=1 Tax=Nitrolancea hollandica TaxID=1206749 RepID=UPI00058EDFAF|nr:HEAT repeat domain-containing protein [Nitrolancea hollandica]
MFSTTSQSANNPQPGRLTVLLQGFAGGRRVTADVVKLSDLGRGEIPVLRAAWPALPLDARRYLVHQMVDLAESNLALHFGRVFHVALTDADPEVRALAISGLWEDESADFLAQLLRMAGTEREPVVREGIAVALGRFAYLAVTGVLDEETGRRIRQALLAYLRPGEPVAVRRRALESLAYFPNDARVDQLIAESYASPIHDLRVSSVFAMGRNLNRRWLPGVLAELESDDPEFRYEAARACGEFGDSSAVDPLLTLIDDEDREVQTAAIGALGQIGGQRCVNVLRRLAESDDIVVREAADEALAQALDEPDPMDLLGL